jgi:hypothetical protein
MGMETRTELTAVRRAISSLGDRGRTTRIPRAIRRQVLSYAMVERSKGKSWRAIGEEVGVSATALQRWAARNGEQRAAIPVRVVPEPRADSRSITLISPSGYRIEGLAMEQALQALRELR